jgi:hypothetical protein
MVSRSNELFQTGTVHRRVRGESAGHFATVPSRGS